MANSVQNTSSQDELRRINQAVEGTAESLRAHRDILRQRGMSLPPGTLHGLTTIHEELNRLSEQLVGDAVELEQLRALAETTELINSSLDVDQVLNEVIDTVIHLTDAERGYIALRDNHTGQMEFRIARNLDRRTIDEGSFIVSRTIVEEVAQTGQPVVTTNAQSDPRFSAQESVVIHALRSILCVPLIVKDEITGVVYADNRIRDALFGEKELSLLVAFANQAAVAIENARLFQSVQMALAEITEMKELMDNVFASIASGVITTNIQEIVTTCNQAAERILETSAEQALGHSLADVLPLIHQYVRDWMAVIYSQRAQEMFELESELRSRGKVYLHLKLTPLQDQEETEGVAIVVDDLTEVKKRDATLDRVRRYLPPAMLDNIQSIDSLGLGGERRVITTMFVETRPFHTFPDDLTPPELMELLNVYLTIGAEAIHNQAGVIDKFMGNEIMGLFNTQLNPDNDHAWLAIQAALKIADEYLLLASRMGETPVPYYRIGIHTGVATIGNVGSPSRREFSAIGDTVNLGKRLQENAEPGQIIISEEVYQACSGKLHGATSHLMVLERSSIQVKGRRQPVQIYEIQPG